MKVLLDHNLPKRLRALLVGHQVTTTRQMGWENLENGELLQAALGAAFGAFLSTDKNLRYEQNLSTLPLPIIVLDSPTNALPELLPFVPHAIKLLSNPLDSVLYVIAQDGEVHRFGPPAKAS